MDLHLHTPASVDYQIAGVSTLDLLHKAEERGLDIIAFTDHNSVRGYADLWREIEDLELLEHLSRLNPNEAARLAEFRRLLDRILVLPGFEFTATFGFHVLAIFPETTSIRLMEHLLLTLGVAEERFGSGEVGATSDVLKAYEILDEHGAIVIGAHVNSSHGVAMQGLSFGGQTKIAYTQDEHLAALEVTDLSSSSRRSTAFFFNGSKTEYPRRMHCIQGSDAHRLDRDQMRESNLGIGDRVTEIQLPHASFDALKDLFRSNRFERTRPARAGGPAADELHVARDAGPSVRLAFHERLSLARTGTQHVLRDVTAMANGDGGVIYIGVGPVDRKTVPGIPAASAATEGLLADIKGHIEPPLETTAVVIDYDGKSIISLTVPAGADVPYELKGDGILVRTGVETRNANRNEIIALVHGRAHETRPVPSAAKFEPPQPFGNAALQAVSRVETPMPVEATAPTSAQAPALVQKRTAMPLRDRAPQPGPERTPAPNQERRPEPVLDTTPVPVFELEHAISTNGTAPRPIAAGDEPETHWDPFAPLNGVEVVAAHDNDGVLTYSLRDLRNGAISEDVPRETTRKLWRYAIQQREQRTVDQGHIRWKGDLGFWKVYRPHRGEKRYNLALRSGGDVRLFYGVGEDGLTDEWRKVIPPPRATQAASPERAK